MNAHKYLCLFIALTLLLGFVPVAQATGRPAPLAQEEDALILAVQTAVAAQYGERAERAVIGNITRAQEWAQGTIGLPVPDGSEGGPDGLLFLAQLGAKGWGVTLEHTAAFEDWVRQAPEELIPAEIRDFLVPAGPAPEGNGVAQLSLPFAAGTSWTLSGGPHANDGGSGPWSSLDFASGGQGAVLAARDGVAYLDCGNFVRINHGNDWQTGYYHLTNIAVSNGQRVSRGQLLGYASTGTGCGGTADGPHVHFSLRKSGAHQAVNGHDIGGWTALNGSAQYNGCMRRVRDGVTRCQWSQIDNEGTLGTADGCGASISGWRGHYWNNRALDGYPALCRDDGSVYFDWGSGGPGGGIGNDNFSARWTRRLSFSAGRYRFSLRGDDGIRLFLDGALIIDAWRDQGATTYTSERDVAGGSHTLQVEYYENGGGAVVQLGWQLAAGGCPAITAWKGEYWNNRTLSGDPVLCRDDASVNFNWGPGGPGGSVGTDNFSARWTRSLSFSAGRYRFSLRGDDGIRLWVDGNLIIDAWRDQGPTTYTAERDLSAGAHSLKVEYYENGGGAEVSLWWETVSTCANQYRAEYFNNRTLSGSPTFTRCENWPINWDWGTGGPGNGVGNDDFSVRWTGTAYIASGSYTFIGRTDDGMRMWLDGAIVIDAWRDQSPTEYRVTRSVAAGNHAVKVEFYENGGGATAQFRWEAASGGGSGNLAVGRPATATSYQGSGYEAYRGNDGNGGTRWSSRISTTLGEEWWWLDLGSAQAFNRVVINWENAYAAQSAIMFSNDQQNWYWFGSWSAVGGPGRYTYDFGTISYRYVGVMMHARAPLMNNYSFWEFELYRNGDSLSGSNTSPVEPVPLDLAPAGSSAPAPGATLPSPR